MSLTFWMFRLSFKEPIRVSLKDEAYYQVFQSLSKDNPLKLSVLVRFMLLPQVHKNFVLSIFDLSFKDFLVPALLHLLPYLALPLFIGHSVGSLHKFFSFGVVRSGSVLVSVIMSTLFFLLSIGLFGYMTHYVYRELEAKKEDLT